MKEAAALAAEWQARMDAAQPPRRKPAKALMQLAINEALVGLTDVGEARRRLGE